MSDRRLAQRLDQFSGEGALAVYAQARALEAVGRDIIHMELGEPDFHPAPSVIATAQAALAAGRDRYCPATGLPALRQGLAAYLRRTRGLRCTGQNLVVMPGCKLALFFALMALVEPGDEVLYPEAGFPAYPSLTRGFGGHPVAYSLLESNAFQPDLAEVERRISPRTRVLILCSPNNPTGTVYVPAVLEGLAELARRHDLWVVSDEIYARVVYQPGYQSIAALHAMEERTIVIDGLSKSFAMTGWRLGYAVAPPEVVAALDLLIANSFTSTAEFTQLAAIEALRDPDHHTDMMVAEYARRRALFCDGIDAIPGLHCTPPDGAFYAWVNVAGTGLPAAALQQRLLEQGGVAAIPGADFGPSGQWFLRFSFAGAPGKLEAALARIRATIVV